MTANVSCVPLLKYYWLLLVCSVSHPNLCHRRVVGILYHWLRLRNRFAVSSKASRAARCIAYLWGLAQGTLVLQLVCFQQYFWREVVCLLSKKLVCYVHKVFVAEKSNHAWSFFKSCTTKSVFCFNQSIYKIMFMKLCMWCTTLGSPRWRGSLSV